MQAVSTPIVKEIVLEAPVEKVWNAITDKNEMKQWYFDLAEFKPEVGFTFQFNGGPDDRVYVHLCEVTEVVMNQKLTYSWCYEGFAGESFVTFELFPEGNATRLRLTHAGLESFGGQHPDLDPKNFHEGWNHIIYISLKEYLEKVN